VTDNCARLSALEALPSEVLAKSRSSAEQDDLPAQLSEPATPASATKAATTVQMPNVSLFISRP
jgi:hypothetical protein